MNERRVGSFGAISGPPATAEYVCAAVHSSWSSRAGLPLFSKLAQISGQLTHLGSHPALVKNKHLQKMAQSFALVSFKEANCSKGKPYQRRKEELDIAAPQQEVVPAFPHYPEIT